MSINIRYDHGYIAAPVLIDVDRGLLERRGLLLQSTAAGLASAESGARLIATDKPDTSLVGWGDMDGPAHTCRLEGSLTDIIIPASVMAELLKSPHTA